MIIYLYIKQHSITKLKYFGKTEKKNPFKYLGSGKRWQRHIKKHGRQHIKTLEIWGFDDQDLCTEFALKFSEDNNIVKSKEWANQIPENGLDGGNRSSCRSYKKHTELTKQKISQSKIGTPCPYKGMKRGIGGNKNPKTKECKEKLSKALKGRPNLSIKGTVSVVDVHGKFLRITQEEFKNQNTLVAFRSKEGQRRILAASSACS